MASNEKELLADMYKNASDEDRAGLRDAMWAQYRCPRPEFRGV